MNLLADDIVQRFYTFLWPMLRISALMITAPIFSLSAFNTRMRILLALVLTWLVFPLHDWPVIDPTSAQGLVELGKAILKFVLVAGVLWWSLANNMDALVQIGQMSLEPALSAAGIMIMQSALWVALSLAVIALIDVPWQKHNFTKQMRMTVQEVKDEFKQMEGSPEVKAQIRRRQREMSNARMMDRVKDADVVITNPEHFAVALEYDPTGDGAPIMVAKGSDHMAALIRAEAKAHGVHLFEAAPLARAIYFTTEVEQQVPEDLYHAVAQVIAYVFSLEAASPMNPARSKPQVKIPPSMQFSSDGKKAAAQGATA